MKALWLSLALTLVGCGQVEDSHLQTQSGSEDFMTKFTCADSSDEFTRLVNAKNYSQAVKFVCNKFSLGCTGKKINFKGTTTGYAYTNALTNQITMLPKAMHYPFCQTPHEGWTAAVLGHEIVHTNQDKSTRWWAAKFSKKKTAELEIEGWQYMWRMRDTFKLNSRMRIEIDSQIEEYKRDLR